MLFFKGMTQVEQQAPRRAENNLHTTSSFVFTEVILLATQQNATLVYFLLSAESVLDNLSATP